MSTLKSMQEVYAANGWRHVNGKWRKFCVNCGKNCWGAQCMKCYRVSVERNRKERIVRRGLKVVRLMAAASVIGGMKA